MHLCGSSQGRTIYTSMAAKLELKGLTWTPVSSISQPCNFCTCSITATQAPFRLQGMTPQAYDAAKEAAADEVMGRLESVFPGLQKATVFREVGTPRTHRRFLGREDGSYGPIPSRRPAGMLGMPMNRTGLQVRAWLHFL